MAVKDTYTPQTIRDLKNYLEAHGAVISIARFCEPKTGRQYRGYHLGKSQIMKGDLSGGCPPSGTADYSIQTARDKAGLTEARAAIDIQFGKARLRDFTRWAFNQARANAPGTQDWREVIGSTDGIKVLRWDRERGYDSLPRAGEADDSHLYHTHISFYRDSESREKVTAVKPYFEPTQEVPVTPDQIKAQQTAINAAGWNPPLVVDGIYGPLTEQAALATFAKVTQQTNVIVAQKQTITAKDQKMSEGLAIKTGA